MALLLLTGSVLLLTVHLLELTPCIFLDAGFPNGWVHHYAGIREMACMVFSIL
jgi:hypothetical protein